MPRSVVLEKIQSLDPVRDHQEIFFLCARVDFPFDMTRSLEFALFRTYCSPSISGLLAQTGEFLKRPQKRYDDTDLIVSELMEWGYDSDRGRAAMRRMNQLHGRFNIANEDFLYVLSTFVFVPIRWLDRFGWRKLVQNERLAMFYFWREVGRRMNIKELPDTIEAFERFNVEYERSHFQYSETNHRVGCATRDLFASWFPGPLRPLVRWVIYAMMDDPLLVAFGFPRPPQWLRRQVESSLRLRARILQSLPPRRKPHLRTETPNRTYPGGYRIEQLGPPS